MCHLSGSTVMSERNYTLRLGKTEGVRVGAVVMSVVTSLAVEAVFLCRAIPNGVIGMKLFAESTPMREWEGSSGMTSLRIVIIILWHGMPL